MRERTFKIYPITSTYEVGYKYKLKPKYEVKIFADIIDTHLLKDIFVVLILINPCI